MTISIGVDAMVQQASDIPALSHAEAGKLSQTEYEQVLALLETLDGSDWQQPTYCTEWNVRDMVAHLAGAVTGSTSRAEFLRQNVKHPYVKEAANGIDGTNRLQLEERLTKTPDELIAEFRQNGQVAVNNRQKLPWLVRQLPVPGVGNFGYLMDIIYPRDQWMHRYDICAATGKKMVVTREHDGRLIDLVLLDIAKKLVKQLASRNIVLRLTGALSSDYQFGNKHTPGCTLEIDFFDFNLRASERISVAEALRRTAVTGDEAAAKWFLTNATVLY
ncbi:maleylpyruvate isomerase family mycothiol-dependent enzyme [Candidatus Leptofilum sp.]|uniref:maleylpyruvate isomerase family mycothiol-dependent enzyme n=1 Tax=Candidatus Leptofilum sp. TaxID=3241576 RepID=UPI003B5C1AFF